MVYDAKNKQAKLFGNSDVKYENMNLISDRMQMSLDSSVVYATGSADTTGKIKGRPIFTMGEDKYESDTIACNFKTKRAFINNVYTEQQDGFLSSQQSKRDSSGVLYLQHGRYTTCDREHPDFYIALSRAKVRPGKDVVFGPAYLVVALAYFRNLGGNYREGEGSRSPLALGVYRILSYSVPKRLRLPKHEGEAGIRGKVPHTVVSASDRDSRQCSQVPCRYHVPRREEGLLPHGRGHSSCR